MSIDVLPARHGRWGAATGEPTLPRRDQAIWWARSAQAIAQPRASRPAWPV